MQTRLIKLAAGQYFYSHSLVYLRVTIHSQLSTSNHRRCLERPLIGFYLSLKTPLRFPKPYSYLKSVVSMAYPTVEGQLSPEYEQLEQFKVAIQDNTRVLTQGFNVLPQSVKILTYQVCTLSGQLTSHDSSNRPNTADRVRIWRFSLHLQLKLGRLLMNSISMAGFRSGMATPRKGLGTECVQSSSQSSP